MADESTIAGTGLERSAEPEAEAYLALLRHREALALGDPVLVEKTLDLHTWGEGDAGILHRLSSELGVEAAVKRLTAFWRDAKSEVERTRLISPDEVEVYERITPSGAPMPTRTVALVRRRGGRWRVVTTSNAPDEKLVLAVLGPRGSGPLPLTTEHCGYEGELRLDANGGVFTHRGSGRRMRVIVSDGLEARLQATDREVQDRIVTGCRVITLGGAAPEDMAERREMMAWAARTAAACARRSGSDAIFIPLVDRVLAPDALAALTVEQVFDYWTAIHDDGEVVVTRGATLAKLPELEGRHDAWANPRPVVEAALAAMLKGDLRPEVGGTVEVAGRTASVGLGRRGPMEGTTYGRWGSRSLSEQP